MIEMHNVGVPSRKARPSRKKDIGFIDKFYAQISVSANQGDL